MIRSSQTLDGGHTFSRIISDLKVEVEAAADVLLLQDLLLQVQ